jgi:hypothetical protein
MYKYKYFNTAELVRYIFFVTSSKTDSQFCNVGLTKRILAGNVNGSPFRYTLKKKKKNIITEKKNF